jgi:Domain of unknown function (DUF5916)/Carbohydrate family 9 binding domain-like
MRLAFLSLVALTAAVAPVHAAPADSVRVPPVRAVRLTGPIILDGVLSEPVWKSDNAVTVFRQSDPVENGTPSESTEVRVAYDDDAIYFGARMYDSHPDSIMARLVRRDNSTTSDRFSIFLDPFHDRRGGYYFMINAAGTLYDGILYNDGWDDNSWDGVWNGRAKIDQEGWVAEIRIPYSQLRFTKQEQQVWGIDLRRQIARRSEFDWLTFTPRKGSGFVSRFPDLIGINGITPRRSVEVLPYATTKAQYVSHLPQDPFHDGSSFEPSGGGDLRMSVGSNLTLNGTVNPDFGQVEVDPAVVNLSDVESFFQEKRPFFVEGSSIFDFGQQGANNYWGFNWPQPTFFYTRRIGRSPQGGVPDAADFSDVPLGTHILGAGKLTGKLGASWNFGTLHAVTAKELGQYQMGGLRGESEVEPRTYYGVLRAQKEFKEGRNGFGVMSTLAKRHFDTGDLQDQLNRLSNFTGVDGWHFLDPGKMWVLSGWAGMSYVQGTEARMVSLQRSARHYFQRPDANDVSVDSSITSLAGYGARMWLNKQKGNAFSNSALGIISPKFDVNDVGFQSRSDLVNGHAGGGYKWTNTDKWKKFADIGGALFDSHDLDGNHIGGGIDMFTDLELLNNYSINTWSLYNTSAVSNRRTRGGPLMLTKPGFELGCYFDTDSKSKLFYSINVDTYNQPLANSFNWSIDPAVEWKPASNMFVSVGPGLSRVVENAQYVTTVSDPLATSTYQKRYVFARLDQRTLSANIRINVSFTPNLSLQTFIQPLIASGDYTDFKELARPKTYDFNHYAGYDRVSGTVDPDGAGPAGSIAVGNPNFNSKSLRGNAVLRWEFDPGSAFYLVWTQERTDTEDIGKLEFSHSLTRLFDAKANNIFLAKVSYYFNL